MQISLTGLPLTAQTLMSVLSLIFWSVTIIVSLKYILIMLRFDHRGEGGVLALLSLTLRKVRGHRRLSLTVSALGVFAAADSGRRRVLALLARALGERLESRLFAAGIAADGGRKLEGAMADLGRVQGLFANGTIQPLFDAPFVPMFALLGFDPAFIQAAYRVGDSATQIITPLNPYIIVILTQLRRYEPKAGIGTLMSRLIVFSVAFWLFWLTLLFIWYQFDLPLGPGASIMLAS